MKNSKKMCILGVAICVAICMSISSVYAFGIPSLTKSKGDSSDSIDWGSIENQSKQTLINLYSGQAELSGAVADLADILGLKEEAAEVRAQILNLDECGSSSCPSFKEVQKADKSLAKVTLSKLGEVDSLTEEQKKKASSAMKKYAMGGVQFALGLKDVKALSEKAMDAPVMQKPKFIGLIKAAPVALKGASSLIETAPKLFEIAKAKDIKVPEEQKSDMMSGLTL